MYFCDMQKLLFILLSILALSPSEYANAQKKNNKKKVKKVKKTDPYTSTEIWEPIPITRQGFHSYVDKSQVEADEMDGFRDQLIKLENSDSKSKRLSKAIIEKPNQLQIVIENLPLDNREKLLYLRELNTNLKKFNTDFKIMRSNVDLEMYEDMMTSFLDIVKIEMEKKDMVEYVRKNFNLGVYANQHMFSENQEAVNLLYKNMVARYPDKMLYKLREFSNTEAADDLITKTAVKSPNVILSYAKSTSVERDIVTRSKDPLVQSIVGLATKTSNSLKALPFIDDIYNKKMTYDDVNKAIGSSQAYYKQLVKSKLNEPKIGAHVINREIKHEALKTYVRTVNELHDSPGPVRFKVTNNLNATELYYLMVLCSDEIYTSSFTGLYSRMLTKMKPQKGNVFLDSLNKDKFRTFIRMSAGYNVLDTFLRTMSESEKNDLMASFVHDIDKNRETDLEDAVDVADALASINDEKTLKFLRAELKKDYERTYESNSKRGLVIYFLLHTISNAILHPNDTTNKLQEALKIPPITKVPYSALTDDSGTVYQQHFFYGDEDGRSSLRNFLANFPSSKWKRDTKKQWIKLTSKSGKPIVIYMNQPLDEPKDEEAQLALNNHLVSQGIEPSILVHRGHSYHLPSTLKYIGPSHKVVILGSCGGYHNLSTILDQSEDAHIVSSKQTGSMHVNDPMIKIINDRLSQGQGVEWLPIWKKLGGLMKSAKNKDLYNDYVPPHKNMGALFLKAFKIQMVDMDETE